jgi:uncharacterized integral membrane protein (TIGR00697 family)
VRADLPLVARDTFGAGNSVFPISYIFDDVLTEVYGYARARRAIWAGFGAMLFATSCVRRSSTSAIARASVLGKLQPALELVFGNTARIAMASIVAYWIGDFANSYVLARDEGGPRALLWERTIGSTIVGRARQRHLLPGRVLRIWTNQALFDVIVFNWVIKVTVEVLATPLTYLVVGWLKRAEGADVYDRDTDFSPFTLRDEGEVHERE